MSWGSWSPGVPFFVVLKPILVRKNKKHIRVHKDPWSHTQQSQNFVEHMTSTQISY